MGNNIESIVIGDIQDSFVETISHFEGVSIEEVLDSIPNMVDALDCELDIEKRNVVYPMNEAWDLFDSIGLEGLESLVVGLEYN